MVQALEGWQMFIVQKVESPGCQSEAFAKPTNKIADFPTAEQDLATLKARMARAGHSVYDGGNNDFIVVKADWCMSRHCPDRSALQRFARVLGVAHG